MFFNFQSNEKKVNKDRKKCCCSLQLLRTERSNYFIIIISKSATQLIWCQNALYDRELLCIHENVLRTKSDRMAENDIEFLQIKINCLMQVDFHALAIQQTAFWSSCQAKKNWFISRNIWFKILRVNCCFLWKCCVFFLFILTKHFRSMFKIQRFRINFRWKLGLTFEVYENIKIVISKWGATKNYKSKIFHNFPI